MSKSSKLKKIKNRVLTFTLLLFLLLAVGGYWYIDTLLNTPFKGYSEPEKIIIIKNGTTVNQIIKTLISEGVLENGRGMRVLLRVKGGENKFKAGEYLFNSEMTTLDVYNKFIDGDVYYHKVTIPEGKDLFDVKAILVRQGLITEEEYDAAISNIGLIKKYDSSAINLEGYLFPDTYLLTRTMSTDQIVSMMVNNFKSKINDEILLKIKDSGKTFREIIIIASLIEKETSLPEERVLVSSVVYNRLRIGMGLQIDPTIIYALKMDGTYDGNLKRIHKKLDSPYNSYKHRGLPPGPICSPGIGAIEAACSPATTKYLYYVSKNDGSHQFSKSVAEHNKAVYTWQVKYWREHWRKERIEKAKQKKTNDSK